jgi:hypothetical protein
MEIHPGPDLVFVGHAKLEPLLALHAVLEVARPGWFLLEWSTFTLHDPPSLRAWFARRLVLAQELASAGPAGAQVFKSRTGTTATPATAKRPHHTRQEARPRRRLSAFAGFAIPGMPLRARS